MNHRPFIPQVRRLSRIEPSFWQPHSAAGLIGELVVAALGVAAMWCLLIVMAALGAI